MLNYQTLFFDKCVEKIKYKKKINKKKYLKSGKFPIISQEDKIINGFWNNPEDVYNIDKPIIIFGDHTRILKYIDYDFVLGADGAKIIKTKPNIIPKYFYYFLLSSDIKSLGYSRHYKLLKKLKLNLPPLPIQEKIVAKLDKIFAEIDKAIAIADTNIQNAKAYFRNFLSEILNNNTNVKNIYEVLKLEYGKSLKQTDRDNNGLYAAYGANGIKTRTNKYLFDKPSIIVGRKGSAGELTLVKEKFWALDVAYYVTHDNTETDINFLFYSLQTKKLNSLAKGVKPGINRNEVYLLKIYVPSINEQRSIVNKIKSIKKSIDKAILLYTSKSIEFSKLKQSILKQAFNGELVKAA
jgi:type I restriction enzyme S subunit